MSILECIDNTDTPGLTKGKHYKVISKRDHNQTVQIINDKGYNRLYFMDRFREVPPEVFIVTKNADFTKGRGPMLFHRVFETWEDAERYVMAQPGIYGSLQMKSSVAGDKDCAHYNGYCIQTEPVMQYNEETLAKQAAIKTEIETLEVKLKALRRELR